MITHTVVRRYAAALLNAAWEANQVDQVESDLGLITYTINSNPELKQALFNPAIPEQRKHAIIQQLFQGKISALTLAYLNLLVDKRRIESILLTEEEFGLMADAKRGILEAIIESAVELNEEELSALTAKLSSLTGKKIRAAVKTNPELIGGIRVRIGDLVLDGTIKGHLEKIHEEMIGRIEPGQRK